MPPSLSCRLSASTNSPSRNSAAARPPSRSALRAASTRSTTPPACSGSVVSRRSIASSARLVSNRTRPILPTHLRGTPGGTRRSLRSDVEAPDLAQFRAYNVIDDIDLEGVVVPGLRGEFLQRDEGG